MPPKRKTPTPTPKSKKTKEPAAAAYTYHADWFSEHAPAWQAVLGGRGLGDVRGARALFVGAYEGMCVAWLMKHALTGPGAEAVVVDDPGEGAARCDSFRGRGVWNPGAHDALRRNMAALADEEGRGLRVDLRLGPRSQADELRRMASSGSSRSSSKNAAFDVVYVDSRSSRHAMESAVLAFPMLRPGGVMVFTNYTHGRLHDYACPKRGIDGFLDAYAPEVRVLRPAFHLFLEKREVPTKHPYGCRAEMFDDGGEPPMPPFRPTPTTEKDCVSYRDGGFAATR